MIPPKPRRKTTLNRIRGSEIWQEFKCELCGEKKRKSKKKK